MSGRWLVSLLLIALLSGCSAPRATPAAVELESEETVVEQPEPMTATLIRVVPRGHAIDWTAYQVVGPCAPDGSEPCRDLLIQLGPAQVGTTYEIPQWSVKDDDAKLQVFARKSCGTGCWAERQVDERVGASPLVIERRDVYLEEGETGLMLRLTAAEGASAPGAGVHFHTTGHADGYVPAGDEPIVISPAPES
jgi:hypothetical protein